MLIYILPVFLALISLFLAYYRIEETVENNHSKSYIKKVKKGWKNKLFFLCFKEEIHPLRHLILYLNYGATTVCFGVFLLSPFLSEESTALFYTIIISFALLGLQVMLVFIETLLNKLSDENPLKLLAVGAVVLIIVLGFVMFIIDYFDVDFSYILFGN